MHCFQISFNAGSEMQFFISNELHAAKIKESILFRVKNWANSDIDYLFHIESDEGDFMFYASQVTSFKCYRPADAQRAFDEADIESELASMEIPGEAN